MGQFKDWIDEWRIRLVHRLAGADPAKVLRLYAAAVLMLGFLIGCLTAIAAQPVAAVSLILLGGACGYGIRSFISFRRRAAWLKQRSSRL